MVLPVPGGPWISATSDDDSANRTAARCDSFKPASRAGSSLLGLEHCFAAREQDVAKLREPAALRAARVLDRAALALRRRVVAR